MDQMLGESTDGLLERTRMSVNLKGSLETPGRGTVAVRVVDIGATGGVMEHPDCLTPGDTSVLCLSLAGVNVRLRTRLRWSYVSKLAGSFEAAEGTRLRSRFEFLPLTQSAEVLLRKYLARPSSTELL